MTLIIEIAPEIESRLEIEAQRNGMSKMEFAKVLIEERLAPVACRPNYMPITPKIIGSVKMRDFSG